MTYWYVVGKRACSSLRSVVGGDHSCTVWLAENSYTTLLFHSVRVSLVGVRGWSNGSGQLLFVE